MQISRANKVKALPLQLVLIVPFVLQVFGIVSLVGYLSFINGQKAVKDLASQLMDRSTDVVDEHMRIYLSVPHSLNQINAAAIRRGLLDVSDRETLGKYFWDQMQTYDLTYIGIGLTTGEGMGVARYDGQTITVDNWTAEPSNNVTNYATDNEGNRTTVNDRWTWSNFNESWYTAPLAARAPVWAKISTLDLPVPYVTASASQPIYDSQNRLLGMIGTDIHLLKLSEFLREIDISDPGTIFLMERDGTLLATSGEQQLFVVTNDQIQRLKAIESDDLLIRGIAQRLQQDSGGLSTITEPQEFQFDVQGSSHFVQVQPWRDSYGLDWLVVIGVPETAFMTQINANTRTTILLSFGALVVASALGILTSQWISRPILRLNGASEAMAAGNLNQAVEVNHPIRELNTLSSSFNHMAGQLSESFAALEKSKEELEDRVEERTAELKDALTELQRTQSQVVQSEKMSSLGQLVAGVAHEINNPVNFIHGNLAHVEGYTQDLMELVQLYQKHNPSPALEVQTAAEDIDLDFLQEDLPKMLSSMKVGTERIRQIVLSLRTFSRMDEAEIKPVNIHEGLDSTLMILQHRLKARAERPEIELVKNYGTIPAIECYAGQLNQVFMNILVNAIDALDESNAKRTYQELKENPGRIEIRTANVGGGWVEVAIADNGPGIPNAVQQRIFDPFFTTKPIGKGTGMGMSISYQIVTEKHGGKLECCSTLGEGTEFKILIPIRQQMPQSA